MGGGRHNRADVMSAPSNRLSSVVVCVGGGHHIRAVVASAPHHEIEPDPITQDRAA